MNENRFYLTTSSVADKLKVCTVTVQNWIKTGSLKAYKVGREYRIDPVEFKKFTDNLKYDNIQNIPNYPFLYK